MCNYVHYAVCIINFASNKLLEKKEILIIIFFKPPQH